MRNIPIEARIAIVMLLAVAIVLWAVLRPVKPRDVERIGFQDADAPLSMPKSGKLDHRFHFPSAWTLTEVPTAVRFDPPMGSAQGALTYNAQKFMEMNEDRGGQHLGDDINGIGGMNSDLGDAIFSVADGLVVYAGEPSEGWGNVVVVAHKTPDGRMLQSMYAHMDQIDVVLGSLVARGEKLGTNGTGNDHYPAHLHLEMRESRFIEIGGGYFDGPLNRIDPMATIAEFRNASVNKMNSSPLAHVLAKGDESLMEMEIHGVEKLFNRLNEKSD